MWVVLACGRAFAPRPSARGTAQPRCLRRGRVRRRVVAPADAQVVGQVGNLLIIQLRRRSPASGCTCPVQAHPEHHLEVVGRLWATTRRCRPAAENARHAAPPCLIAAGAMVQVLRGTAARVESGAGLPWRSDELAGIDFRSVGHGREIGLAQLAGAVLDHLAIGPARWSCPRRHLSSGTWRSRPRPAAQAGVQVGREVEREPAVDAGAGVGLVLLDAAQGVARRMAGTAMAQALHQVGTAVPRGRLGRIGLEGALG